MPPPPTTTKLPTLLEFLPQVRQTLGEIDRRTPNALRAALGLDYSYRRPNEDEDDVATLLASVLPAPSAIKDDEQLPFAGEEYSYNVDGPEGHHQRMDWAPCYIPHTKKDHDEHFVNAGAGVVGVADGVGGYRADVVDAGAFARGLMAVASREVRAAGTPMISPLTLLQRAYIETVAAETPGASTAVILALAGDALRWVNVGDSAFAVLRGGAIVHRSQPQLHTHAFNTPRQLSCNQTVVDGIGQAESGETPVRCGDIVVVGTDGLFDNLFDAELERVVQMGTALGFSPKNMADVLAGIAKEMSENVYKDTPYSVAHRQHHGSERRGGKPDDITVLVAYIREEEEKEKEEEGEEEEEVLQEHRVLMILKILLAARESEENHMDT